MDKYKILEELEGGEIITSEFNNYIKEVYGATNYQGEQWDYCDIVRLLQKNNIYVGVCPVCFFNDKQIMYRGAILGNGFECEDFFYRGKTIDEVELSMIKKAIKIFINTKKL